MSLAQKRALVALVSECGALGSEVTTTGIAERTGLKPNAAALALHGLVRRRLAMRHDGPEAWSPTLSGRSMAKYVRASEPRTAPAKGSTRWDH